MCNFTHPKSLEELSMMRHWILEAGLPQLIWVAVYGAAAFFSYRRSRQKWTAYPLCYLMGCLSMLLVFLVDCLLMDLAASEDYWKRSFQQAVLFVAYQLHLGQVMLSGKDRTVKQVLFVGAGVYLLVSLFLRLLPFGDWLSVLGAIWLHMGLVRHFIRSSGRDHADALSSLEASEVRSEMSVAAFRFRPEDFDAGTIPGKLLRLLQNEKLYLKPNLTIDEVSLEVGTNRAYLSKCVNIELQVNFRELVNAYRIQEAMVLFEEDPNLSLTDLCQRCGFNNYSSFTFSFKLNTGQTPGEWCREVKQRKQNEKEG